MMTKDQDAVKDSADEEVAKYLRDTSIQLSAINAYPMIKQLYVRLNTTVPASSADERLLPRDAAMLARSWES